jgi:hypothetical protein
VFELPTKGLSDATLQGIELFDEICTALGLPKGEVMKIGDEVADFWKHSLQDYQSEPITDDAWWKATRGADHE